jgi:tRNA(Arg) A34 adenosine deaminase TadA
MKTVFRIFTGLAVIVAAASVVIALLLAYPFTGWEFNRFRQPISQHLQDHLRTLGMKALETSDVPVAAVVLYGDSVIGEGYNTVIRDANAGGHAEINALSSALQSLGIEKFKHLNRDSLCLLSTFEPCPMCRGAILEYNIRHVEYMKSKSFSYSLREEARLLIAGLRVSQREPSILQDSLFEKHPSYPHR